MVHEAPVLDVHERAAGPGRRQPLAQPRPPPHGVHDEIALEALSAGGADAGDVGNAVDQAAGRQQPGCGHASPNGDAVVLLGPSCQGPFDHRPPAGDVAEPLVARSGGPVVDER